jgi:S1-C subfamily serine protease
MKYKVFKPVVWLAILIMMISLACNAGTTTTTQAPAAPTKAEQPATEPPTAAPQPVKTEAPAEVVTEAPATAAPPSGLVTNLQDVKKATIQIESQGTFIDPQVGLVVNGAGRGSGFIIDPSGIAVTNNHVVTGAALLKVWVGGETTPRNAKVLGVSECSDLAVIDIDGDGYPYLDWYNGSIDPGMDIYVAGYPLGEPEYSLTKGIISKAKANGETNWASVDSVIEYDATTNPGNSGGPVITPDGQVVGVHYAGSSSTRQAFGISRDIAKGVIDKLRTGTNIDTIGVNGQAVGTEDGSLTGVWVSSVQSGSPADKAGVQAGDIITMMENLVLASDGTMSDYCDILRSHKPGDTLNLQVLRWASSEVLEGQLNGRELAVTSTYDSSSNTNSDSGNTGGEEVNTNASASGDIYYRSEFDNGLSDWSYFLTQGQDSGFSAQAVDGKFHFEFTDTDTYVYMINNALEVDNVQIDTRAENLGRNNNNVSLICRYSDNRGWYEFNIANNGLWWIYLYDDSLNQPYVELAKGGSNLIKMGKDTNDYTAICNGNQLTLGINGKVVKTITDNTLKSGKTGLSVSSFNVTPIIVDFDDFILSVP